MPWYAVIRVKIEAEDDSPLEAQIECEQVVRNINHFANEEVASLVDVAFEVAD